MPALSDMAPIAAGTIAPPTIRITTSDARLSMAGRGQWWYRVRTTAAILYLLCVLSIFTQ
jgi:hypothetical protein